MVDTTLWPTEDPITAYEPQLSPLVHTEVPCCHAMELLFSPTQSLVGVSSHQNQQEQKELQGRG